MTTKDLQREADALARVAAELSRRTSEAQVNSVRAKAEAKDEAMARDSEAYRRSPREHRQRTIDQMVAEELPVLEVLTGDAMFRTESAIARVEPALRASEAAARADVTRTLPDLFNHFRPGDMLAFINAREALRPRVGEMTADELKVAYGREGIEGGILKMLIEERVARRQGITRSMSELPAFRTLAAMIKEAQDARVPAEVADVAEALALAKAAVNTAQRSGVIPINVAHDPTRREILERALAAEGAAA